VQLHTIKTLKIIAPQTDIIGDQKEMPALKKEKKTIPAFGENLYQKSS
jgi:hypothetical protein